MNDNQRHFLALLGHPPARLTAEQTAWALNCADHDVPILVAARLLKPLGNPAQNGTKYFATQEVLELSKDQKWLNRMSAAISQHWHTRNARKKDRSNIDSLASITG